MPRTILHGHPEPLGAYWDGQGVGFAVASHFATSIELCLFDSLDAPLESERLTLPGRTEGVFHGYLPGLRPGTVYGFRAHGPWAPKEGHWFNPHRLLIDPYARAFVGSLAPGANLCAQRLPPPPAPAGRVSLSPPAFSKPSRRASKPPPRPSLPPPPPPPTFELDRTDSAPFAPRCLVVDEHFEWGEDRSPAVPWTETVLYEAHVKSLTRSHPEVPESLRGTYLGLASDPVLEHLTKLGVTTVELLPIHEIGDEPFLTARGLRNHWGYNTLGFFAPAARYASSSEPGAAVQEFKQLVKALHARGLEVVLDVVFNHTCEGNQLGPCVSFRGLDNSSYYHLAEADRSHYTDYTGCGNSVDTRNPLAMRLVMDCLRYWVMEMHVDGFRFDLAVTLGRGPQGFDPRAPLFSAMAQDPVLRRAKWIAEPWDVGPGGYHVGGFGGRWREWNGRYRDTVRRYWKGAGGQRPELASRLAGSADIFEPAGRTATASVNFVTAHDGFTLTDLVSYTRKHNEANGEDNRDGSDSNDSDAYGPEGPTEDAALRALRARQRRNLLATLLCSQGVPMLLAGDELGHTQSGNNNPFCQDNALTWLRWPGADDAEARAWLDFVRAVVQLRKAHPVLRRDRFFTGAPTEGHRDLVWLRSDGTELRDERWHEDDRTLGMLLSGRATGRVLPTGQPMHGETLLVLFHAGAENTAFDLRPLDAPKGWEVLFDTRTAETWSAAEAPLAPSWYVLLGRSMALLRRVAPG